MRVMVLVKANEDSEAGVMPPVGFIEKMGRFNTELVNAGVLLAADGLTSSAEGKRVRFEGEQQTVLDGPFAETKELVSGFWIWQVASMDEALEWITRSPFYGTTVELRRILEAADFGDALTPEAQAMEEQLRKRIADGATQQQ